MGKKDQDSTAMEAFSEQLLQADSPGSRPKGECGIRGKCQERPWSNTVEGKEGSRAGMGWSGALT